jgi:hypothetical protein
MRPVRRRLALAAALTLTGATGAFEIFRHGYAAPMLFGARQWACAVLRPGRRAPVNEVDPFI